MGFSFLFSLPFSSPILILVFLYLGVWFFFVVAVVVVMFGFVVYVCSGSELAQIMEMEAFGTTSNPSVGRMRPPEAEIEGFFAAAEMRERMRFTDK